MIIISYALFRSGKEVLLVDLHSAWWVGSLRMETALWTPRW